MSTKFFPLDLSKFKRVSSDKHTTTLRHDAGHEVKIAHNALSPKLRGHLAGLPEHKESNAGVTNNKSAKPMMADGGSVYAKGYYEKKDEQDAVTKQELKNDPKALQGLDHIQSDEKAQQMSDANPGLETLPPMAKGGMVKKYADGGDVQAADPMDMTALAQQQPTASAIPQTIDPAKQAKIDFYNQQVNSNFSPNPTITNQPQSFGPNGEPPQDFRADAWKAAEDKFNTGEAQKGQAIQAQAQKIEADNVQRQKAGLPTITPPPGMAPQQAPAPSAATPQAMSPQTQTAQNQDPFGTQLAADISSRGINEAKAGIHAEANALGQEAAIQEKALNNSIADKAIATKSYQDHFKELDQERTAFQQDIVNAHIDPNHFLGSQSTVQKVATGIGLILGGMGSGLTGQPNGALTFLQMQIENDIKAQQANLGKKENLLSANMRQFGNLRDATDMTRIMQNDMVATQMKQAAAKTGSALAQSRAMQAIGKIDMDTAQLQGQMAMRKTLLSGVNAGKVSPDKIANLLIPEKQRDQANKELKDAQDAVALRDDVLNAYDKIAKINTVGNRMMNPIQSARQIDAIQGPVLDKLTKDTSGRVTPETVKLVGSAFSKIGSNEETLRIGRKALLDLTSQGMHYPILKTYGIDPNKWGQHTGSGQSRIPFKPRQ